MDIEWKHRLKAKDMWNQMGEINDKHRISDIGH